VVLRLSTIGGLRPKIAVAVAGLVVAAARAVQGQQNSGESDAPPPEGPGFLEIVFSGGLVGIAIMSAIILLSVLAAGLIIDHFLTVRRRDVMPPGLADKVRLLLSQGQSEQAREACTKNPGVLSFVLLHGIAEIEFGWTAVEKALEDALAEQSARLYRRIEYLSVIGNLAPMLGLLGTVVGMILSFHQVAISQGTAGASQLAEGIYQALVTTVGGLMVAIPAIGAFAAFRNHIDQLLAETAYTVQHVFAPLRRRKRPSGSA
jgi:biopolymer transport protein ExbB